MEPAWEDLLRDAETYDAALAAGEAREEENVNELAEQSDGGEGRDLFPLRALAARPRAAASLASLQDAFSVASEKLGGAKVGFPDWARRGEAPGDEAVAARVRAQCAEAASAEEVVAVCRVFPEVEVPVRWLAALGMEEEGDRERGDLQLRRDIERDTLVVNGRGTPGVQQLERVMAALRASVRRARAVGVPAAPAAAAGVAAAGQESEVQEAAFAREVLRVANRTHSGGVAFAALTRLLSDSECVLLRPDAAATQPLRVNVDEGAFPGPSSSSADGDGGEGGSGGGPLWGVRARVETALGFELYSVASGEPVARVASARVVYQTWLACPLLPVAGEEPAWALEGPYQRGSGVARVEFQVPSPVAPSAETEDGPAREPVHARQRTAAPTPGG